MVQSDIPVFAKEIIKNGILTGKCPWKAIRVKAPVEKQLVIKKYAGQGTLLAYYS
ncbi:MAG TPA: hypothetical protein VLX68_14610 [Chitinivibrionales bacterium]|nr:hypothetical protein [Chitinivibrionales bacterium]